MLYWWEQAGCVPFRQRPDGVQVGLITNRNGDWIFPKGTVDPGDTPAEAAAQEAWEEAGWEGRMHPYSLVDVHRPKLDVDCRIRFFALEVTREHEAFPESWRERCWVTPDTALHQLADTAMRTALQAWIDRREINSRPVLFVCRTNLGASLMAEYLWRANVRDPHRFPVASAGVQTESGLEVPPLVASVLEDAHLDAGPHRAQPVSAPLLEHASHVFCCDDRSFAALEMHHPGAAAQAQRITEVALERPDAPDPKQYRTFLHDLAAAVQSRYEELT